MDDIQKEVASLDDSSLREQLLAAQIPIGPIVKSTRPIYEKKLIEFISKERGIANENSPTSEQDQTWSTNSKADESKAANREVLVNSSPQTSTPKRTGSDSYFVVCIPVIECDTTDPEFITPSKAASHMFEDQKEALKLLKKNPGARFKVFRSRKDAESFAGLRENLSTPRSVEIERKEKNATLPKLSQDSPNEFRSPKAQQYVALRKAIISQDKDKFKELVWSNPRYLISTGDTPTILQEGPRYNAVHICAQKNLPEMCSLVLEMIQDPEFFQRMYTDEPEQILAKRMTHIVDLYINVPDKGNFETPLHFACKFGNLEMVEFLLSYQICERSCKNRYGETPAEIICNRSNESKQDQIIIKEKIMDLLDPINEEVFIPVFRSEDNTSPPHIGQPWSPASSDSQSGQSFDSLKSPVDVDWSVKAFAGPMSPKEASDLYQRWKGRCTGRNKEDSHIQRSDEEKGLERIGRKLSQSAGVQWKEYWDFLEEFVDLATSEGLQKLENYLTVKYKELQEYTVTERDIMDDVVRDLKNQFDVMDVKEAALNNKPTRLVDDGHMVKPNSGHCAQDLEDTYSLQESCEEPTCSKHDSTKGNEDRVKIESDRICLDHSGLVTDVDEICNTLSNLRLSDSSSTNERTSVENRNQTLLDAGDCGGARMNPTANNSADGVESRSGISSTSTDGSENVFSSPEELFCSDSSRREELVQACPQKKRLYIMGDAPSRRDMDVFRAIQHVDPTDRFPFVRKWKHEIEDVADHLRLKWPTPRRKLRRSISNPSLPFSPTTSQSRVFTFSPLRFGDHRISPAQLHRPTSEQYLTSSSLPVVRLFAE